jgi:hypothetical protein
VLRSASLTESAKHPTVEAADNKLIDMAFAELPAANDGPIIH